jgi:hypothetical protein
MRDYCKHWYTSCRCRRLAGVGAKLFVVLSLLLFMTASYAQFQLGTARVTSVVPVNDPGFPNPACVRQDTPPRGTEHWDVRQDHTYRVRLEGVTECSGDTIQVHIFNPFRRVGDPDDCYAPQCLTATRVGEGIYEFEVNFDNYSSKTYYIRYCTNSDCSAGGFLARRSDGGSAPSLLRLAHFDPRTCEFIREDKTCFPKGCPTIDKLELGCNPERIPDCSELYDRLYSVCEGCPIIEIIECRNGEDESDPDRGPCWKKRRIEFDVIDCEFRFYTVVGYINWQEDEEPPVFEQFPEDTDLGCNPRDDQFPSCESVLAQVVVSDACDNPNRDDDDVVVECFAGEIEELSKCRFRQVFTVRATDKCGNVAERSVTYTWKIDTEPPVVNNVPEAVDLGCNPAELPSCEWLIATYGIEAKDNCVEEGNAPTLYCEAGPIEELSKCRFRQTFRFWAVDKSECGNRSQDYITVVTWKIDTEPPTVNNVPAEVNLGCNPAVLPSCDWLIAEYGIEAKDNCVEEGNAPTLYCEAGPIEELSKCRFRQTFRFWAVDKSECGNRSQDYITVVTWKIDTEPPVVNNVPAEVNLGCNPAELPSCDWLIAEYGIEAKDNCVEEGNAPTLYCEAGPIEELSKCRFRQTFRFWAVDKSECGNRSQDYFTVVTWKIDTEPPVVNNVPAEVNLGCNPAELPSCDWLIATYGIEAKDNCTEEGNAPTLYCEAGPIEELSKCRFRQTFRFWAVDKSECGNRSQDYITVVTWKIDTEPPVVNNVPEAVDLGCNPAEPPSCEWLIATYGIEAKDNCVEEGNAPTLYCEPGPIEELSKCRFRQTFRFWAVDKSECGNRSQDYFTVVTWKIDTEPPTVNNVPAEVNLGCNPAELPSCDWLIAEYGIEAKDNCVEEGNAPTLYCEAGPIEELSKCRYRQTFRFWAVDKSECGNRSQDYFTVVTWKIDTEPPVVNNVPAEVNLGCNPAELPSCEWLIAEYGIEAKDNCVEEGNAPTLYCEAGPIEELSKCRYRQTFRFWAVDKSECGNRSQDYFTVVTWKIDTEPPVVNNVPAEVNLGCNPAELPSCEWLIAEYGIEAKDNCVEEGNAPTLYCEAGPIEELSKCRYRQTFRFWAVDKSECGNRSQDYFTVVTWKIDTEPPTVNNVPEAVDLGCNPAEPPSCEWLIATYGIEAKDNCVEEGNAPTLYCEAGPIEELPNCRYRQTFRFWAVDKSECGNRSQDYFTTVTWQIDTVPPVINNLPRGGKLPCNTRPSCEYLIERYNINVKDNCDKEPQLFCEAGEVEQVEDCQFRQTFRFWAVDKCGNRTQDYFVTFFWKEDTEPPVLHNLPEGGDLGCNPSELPTCETIGGGVTATDNCDPNPRVTCFSSDLQIGCLRIRSFNFVAADECGNVATAKVFYYWTVDTTPPVVRCPDNIVVQADPKECFVEVRWRAKADDDCDPNPRLVCDPPSGSLFPLGTTTVTCTATDRCGNTASCSFTVTVLGFICGTKFHDLNGNGVRDRGEPGLEGWTIELVDPATNTVLQTVVTGPDGRYCFLGLQLGDYIVREVLQPGWENTTPIERRVNLPRDCGKQVDFGNRRSQ